MANDGWEQGWHERNGGNYRIVWGLVKMLSMRPDKLQTIIPQDFRDLAADFKVELPEKFLYDK